MRLRDLKFLLLSVLALPLVALADPVRIQTGLVAGAPGRDAGVLVYKGIPFAAPPVGDLRWKPPQAPAAWTGVRPGSQFSAMCVQTPYPVGSLYHQEPEPVSEDCLYLNVWTAAKAASEKRPVMVWIHGGALTRGSGSTPVYDGEALARKGVVLVTINYRLGALGFLAHPALTAESERHSSGNYGLLDQIAALEWVQRNIASFGGDPKRVTIFGESAGSWSVNYMVATPLAKGLFQRAIGESGGAFGKMKTLAECEQAGVKFAESAGAPTLAELRAKPAADILKVADTGGLRPNVDGWMLPEDVYSVFAHGRQNDVPLIAGSNADEGTSLSPWPADAPASRFISDIKRGFTFDMEEFLKLYPASTDDEARQAHYASFRDFSFGWQMRTWVRMAEKTGRSKAYLYYFSRVPPGPQSARYGAFHASEIAYVFGNLLPPRPWEDADRKLSDAVSSYWVNFAKTGDPNGAGLPKWPAYDEKADVALEFGDAIHLCPNLHKPALDFFDRYFAAQRNGVGTH